MSAIVETLSSVGLGEPVLRRNLALFPLLREQSLPPFYLRLADAIATRRVTVTEVSEHGSVPSLRVVNELDRPVLILDGEQLVGAKQNRIVNLTILVPAGSKLDIPVSCVEQGRWGYRSREFAPSDAPLFAAARAAKASRVSDSLAQAGRRDADQAAVWDEVAFKLAAMACHSSTGAVEDLYQQRRTSLEAYLGIEAAALQAGAVFAIDGQVRGAEVFDSPETLRRALPQLVTSYALDALETDRDGAPAPRAEDAVSFLDAVRDAAIRTYPAVGLGEDLRFEAPGIAGAALAVDRNVVHLCAFRVSSNGGHGTSPGTRIARSSERRRWLTS